MQLKNAQKGSLVELLREHEKWVFTAGHPHNPFQGKYPQIQNIQEADKTQTNTLQFPADVK